MGEYVGGRDAKGDLYGSEIAGRAMNLPGSGNACNVPGNRRLAEGLRLCQWAWRGFRGPRKGLLAPCTGHAEKSISWAPHRRDMPLAAREAGARSTCGGPPECGAVQRSGWGPEVQVWTPTAPSTPGEPGSPPCCSQATGVYMCMCGYLYGAPSSGLHVLHRTWYLCDAAVIDVDVTAPAIPLFSLSQPTKSPRFTSLQNAEWRCCRPPPLFYDAASLQLAGFQSVGLRPALLGETAEKAVASGAVQEFSGSPPAQSLSRLLESPSEGQGVESKSLASPAQQPASQMPPATSNWCLRAWPTEKISPCDPLLAGRCTSKHANQGRIVKRRNHATGRLGALAVA
ncbi:hypothetical protein CCMA1212_003039 [Trichoderma ghanense]|uniref:Uncharacterized protein n=1 Tax=Trichoderma ghanense TaxID=65468 RepID=A0ABY2HAP3_9HYPO